MDVLYWIRGKQRQFRPIMANRIGQIQSETDPEQWQYSHSKKNPADMCYRREVLVRDLTKSKLQWEGPTLKINKLAAEMNTT